RSRWCAGRAGWPIASREPCRRTCSSKRCGMLCATSAFENATKARDPSPIEGLRPGVELTVARPVLGWSDARGLPAPERRFDVGAGRRAVDLQDTRPRLRQEPLLPRLRAREERGDEPVAHPVAQPDLMIP